MIHVGQFINPVNGPLRQTAAPIERGLIDDKSGHFKTGHICDHVSHIDRQAACPEEQDLLHIRSGDYAGLNLPEARADRLISTQKSVYLPRVEASQGGNCQRSRRSTTKVSHANQVQ